MIKKIIDEFKQDLEYALDKNNINRINRLLGNTLVILTYIAFIDLLIIMLVNFIVNFVVNFKIDYLIKGDFFYNKIIKISNFFRFSLIFQYPLIYIILFLFLIIFSIHRFIKHKDSYGDFNIEQQGNTRWATDEELDIQYLSVLEDPLDKYGNINWINFRTGYPVATRIINNQYICYIDNRPAHSLNLGSTRGGKSQIVILRFIDILSRCLNIKDRASIVVNDPKLELYSMTGRELRENRGYDVHVINFQDTNYSIHVNLLQQVTLYWQQGLYDEAIKEARYLSEYMFSDATTNVNGDNKFFDEAAIGYLNALIIAHTEDCIKYGMPEKNNMPSIYQTHVQLKGHTYQLKVSNNMVKTKTYLDDYFNNRSDDSRAKQLYISKLVTDATKTRDNIFMTVLNQLELFGYEDMENISIKSDLDFLKIGFGKKPVALFIGSDEIDHSKDKLIVMLITSMYRILSRQAVFTGKCKRCVHYIWDEFGQSPVVKDMQTMVSMGAGKNLFFHLFLQSFQQMVAVYGETTAMSIKENLDIQVFIKGNTTENTEEIANLIGTETYLNKTRHGATFSNDKTITEQQDGRTLVTADELRRMPKGSTLVARTDVREDKYGNSDNYDLEPFPIDNRAKNKRFRFAKDYLNDVFDTNATFNDMKKYTAKLNKEETKNKKFIFNALDYTRALNKIKYELLNTLYVKLCSYFSYYVKVSSVNKVKIDDINKKIRILKNGNEFFEYPLDDIFKDLLTITDLSFNELISEILHDEMTFLNRITVENEEEFINKKEQELEKINDVINEINNIITVNTNDVDLTTIDNIISYLTALIVNNLNKDEYSQEQKQALLSLKNKLIEEKKRKDY
ncbi:type IV secretory system conjugative DNA transfer family protein [Anaerofustis sp. HA2171]|uniref:type IV secretory system conjugative DNA transfer family protein n=1 Tax=Anaerofustis butyriciformans TaxID=3108533 RepID=UPI002E3452C0|nr:type IV secretory system conjugative DNA transfer family protein [Anaerofustis sp. HA2171]